MKRWINTDFRLYKMSTWRLPLDVFFTVYLKCLCYGRLGRREWGFSRENVHRSS